jgi:hypothetical protein
MNLEINICNRVDTTRRALDPEALGANVADNIDEVMGQSVQAFAKGIKLNLEAAQANQNAASKTTNAAQGIQDHTDKLNMERNALAAIARHLEERDARSKWDWVTLAAGMAVAALLAGGGGVYYAKDSIAKAGFSDAIRLIQNDEDGEWCTKYANAQIIDGRDDSKFCAIHMPEYQETKESDE